MRTKHEQESIPPTTLIIQPFLVAFAKTKLKNQKSYLNLEDVYPFSAILRIRNVHFFLLLEQATEISEGEKENGIENLFYSNYRGPDMNKKAYPFNYSPHG